MLHMRIDIRNTTDLHKSDEDDKERRRTTRVMVGVVFPVPFLRKEFIADHADHPVIKEIGFIDCPPTIAIPTYV